MIDRADIATRVTHVNPKVQAAAEHTKRSADDITVVAVAKTWPADAIEAARSAGLRDIGENRAQELRQKVQVLGSSDIRWHFVGPLQTNKVRQVVGVSLIHSVDRIGLAEAIARRAVQLGSIQDVLIQVNVGGEATKTGVEPAQAMTLASAVSDLDGIHVRGFMTIPPLYDDPEAARSDFRSLRALRDDALGEIPSATELSMGMTHDYVIAIEEGATIVRIGTAIFGPRNR